MAMSLGGTGRPKADINVTPMIDVLLVLLIIFMVVVRLDTVGLDALVPQAPNETSQRAESQDVVITVNADGSVEVNQEHISADNLDARLRLLLQSRGNRVLFFRAAENLDFEPVARVIDLARGVGLTKVALMPGRAAPF